MSQPLTEFAIMQALERRPMTRMFKVVPMMPEYLPIAPRYGELAKLICAWAKCKNRAKSRKLNLVINEELERIKKS